MNETWRKKNERKGKGMTLEIKKAARRGSTQHSTAQSNASNKKKN